MNKNYCVDSSLAYFKDFGYQTSTSLFWAAVNVSFAPHNANKISIFRTAEFCHTSHLSFQIVEKKVQSIEVYFQCLKLKLFQLSGCLHSQLNCLWLYGLFPTIMHFPIFLSTWGNIRRFTCNLYDWFREVFILWSNKTRILKWLTWIMRWNH